MGLNENCIFVFLYKEIKKGENVKREILERRYVCIGFKWCFRNVKYIVWKCKVCYFFFNKLYCMLVKIDKFWRIK